MPNELPFGTIVEAADQLPPEDQETLIEVLKSRLRDRRRMELAEDVHEAQKEFGEGRARPVTPAELMKEILP